MRDIHAHYSLLLGLGEDWRVDDVEVDMAANRVVIRLAHEGGRLTCPKCQQACTQADLAPVRQWRHLDTMQFETFISAAVPRSRCSACGVKTVAVPWAGKHSRFTLFFECVAIRVLLAARSVQSAGNLLKISWSTAHTIMARAVERGLNCRDEDEIKYVGIDEKSFGKGQDYVSLMVDIEGSRVLEVARDRSESSCNELIQSLTDKQKTGVQAVAVDFWQAFRNSIKTLLPDAAIVHDRFHVSQYLGEAVDLVRRKENKSLRQAGDESLKKTRQLWLYNEDNLDEAQLERLQHAQQSALKTSRAWAIKEMFRDFWLYHREAWGKKFFDRWYAWAIRSRLEPVKKVAVMLKKHLPGLLAFFSHPITNGKSEAFNGRVQSIKSSARGFRNFQNYRTRILFYCGKLKLLPELSH